MQNLEQILASLDESAQKVLVLGCAKHPVWDDANEVFALATRQILDKSLGRQEGADYGGTVKFYGTAPVAFIGVHTASCEEA